MQQKDYVENMQEDPRPMPPEPPGDFDCCQNGCGEACVWEIHEYAKRDYARKLAAWLARHPEQV